MLFLILASSLVLKIPFKITICGQFFRPTWEVESHFQNISPDAGRERLFKKNITINKTKSLVCHLITYIQYLAYFQYIELQPLNSNNLLKALGLAKGGSFAVFSEGLWLPVGQPKASAALHQSSVQEAKVFYPTERKPLLRSKHPHFLKANPSQFFRN